MITTDDELIPVFVPALSVLLLHAEDQKGTPLTPEEVLDIRDHSACIMIAKADAAKLWIAAAMPILIQITVGMNGNC